MEVLLGTLHTLFSVTPTVPVAQLAVLI